MGGRWKSTCLSKLLRSFHARATRPFFGRERGAHPGSNLSCRLAGKQFQGDAAAFHESDSFMVAVCDSIGDISVDSSVAKSRMDSSRNV